MRIISNKIQYQHVFNILIVVFVFVSAGAIAIGTGYNTGPDEGMRYPVCDGLLNNSGLPDGRDPSIRNKLWGFSYAFSPYFAQIISSGFMRFTSLFTTDVYWLIVSARFTSVIFITLYALFCILIANKLFKSVSYKYLFIVLAVFIPQLIYLGGYINNDSFALFTVALIVYTGLLGFEKQGNYATCLLLAFSCGLCLLSYYNAYGGVLISSIVFVVSCYLFNKNIKSVLLKSLLIIFVVFITCGGFFIRNYIIYDGDFLGFRTSSQMAELYAVDYLKPTVKKSLYEQGVPISAMLFGNLAWIRGSYTSFIGIFGYLTVPLSNGIYLLYTIIWFFGIAAVLICPLSSFIIKFIANNDPKTKLCLERYSKGDRNIKVLGILALVSGFMICLFLSFVYSYFGDFQAQGRYFITIAIPLAFFVAIGGKWILDLLNNKVIRNLIISVISFSLFIIIILSVIKIVTLL